MKDTYSIEPGDRVNIRINGKNTQRTAIAVGREYVKCLVKGAVMNIPKEQITSHFER